jgi:hypothetical protein
MQLTVWGELTYYHGTGFLAHDFWDSKYDQVCLGTQRRVLEEIIKNGLKPFPDPFNSSFEGTISVTKDIKYALLYALLFAEKGTSDRYGINRWKEWKRILWRIFSDAKPFALWKYRSSVGRKVGTKELGKWVLSFNDVDYRDKFLWWLRWMIWWESNIAWNFPVVLWFKDIKTETREMLWWNEHRLLSWIPPDEIAAIFVPRDKIPIIPETNIPVFPLEDLINTLNH